MQLHEIERMARAMMDTHGLYDWRFEFDRGVNRAGACHFGTRSRPNLKITLSRMLMPTWSEEAIRNVMLHEIAHALAGPGHGHDRVWRAHARRIGCTGDRCWTPGEDSPQAPPRYIGTCPNGHTSGRERLPAANRQPSCGKCSRRYDPSLVYRWERNPQRVAA